MAHRVSRKRFTELAEQALAEMPLRFRKRLANIVILVEDAASPDDAGETGVPADELLGLFRGAPFDEQGMFDLPRPLPDTVVLFQQSIEAVCGNEGELREEIRLTLLHEIGHYFGLSEKELAEYE